MPIVRFHAQLQPTSQASTPFATRLSALDIDTDRAVRSVYEYLVGIQFGTIASSEELKTIIEEVRANKTAMDVLLDRYSMLWTYLSLKIGEENRSLEEIVGKEIASKIISAAEGIDIYEPTTVRTFLANPVFETMLGGILYEGIFEFLQKVDIIGSIINRMPIIGAIRQAVIKEFKSNLDKTVGVQIKGFLTSFNKVAVQRMAEFVLSPQNKPAFKSANKNIAAFIINRNINTMIPHSGETNRKLKDMLWRLFSESKQQDINKLIDFIYDKFGDKSLASLALGSYDDVMSASPTLKNMANRNLEFFLRSEEGRTFMNSCSGKG